MAKAAKQETQEQGFVYPEYDLWKVEVESIVSDKDGDPKQVKFTAVKIERKGVKLEDNVANLLNGQSHNSRKRYYPKGKVQNGDEETVTIK